MAPFTYFLAFARLAPVQAVTWGHPVTTGIANIDYFVSSAPAEPAGAVRHYGERLIELPVMSNSYARPLPLPHAARAELGLPEAGTVYLCPQSLFKLHPDFDGLLAAILARDPAGAIVLLAPAQPLHAARLLARLARHVPPAALKRVRFAPWLAYDRFLALIAAADVMLDPIVFGGGNTSYEALALGIPVVTLAGTFLRGRLTLGMYRQMGFDDLVPLHSGYDSLLGSG
jgi:predicted O-linked N-acetylglucosamine transferase (SPINDLY family)